MSWDIFQRSLNIAKENRIDRVNFFGGEPLLNPLFFPMLQTALEKDFSLIIATNCRLLDKEPAFSEFLNITKQHKKQILIVTARDKFHLPFFDPAEIIALLKKESYEIVVNDYSNNTIALSEYNSGNQDLQQLNTQFSCCNANPNDYLGILPDGGWTICPASLEGFTNIFTNSLSEIICFKKNLPLQYEKGCTECLKDFKTFHKYLR
jgi:organic radical activating enzyme